jgi:hypothetical protein
MNDAEYRKEIRAKETYIQQLVKETKPSAITYSTGAGKGRRKAKKQYFLPGDLGVQFTETINTINKHLKFGLENPEYSDHMNKERERINDRAIKLTIMKDSGSDIHTEELRAIEEKEGRINDDGFTEKNLADLELLDYSSVSKMHSTDVKRLLDAVKFLKKEGRLLSDMQREEWKIALFKRNAMAVTNILPKGKELLTGPERRIKKGKFLIMTGDMSFKSLLNNLESERELKPGEKNVFLHGPLQDTFNPIITKSEETQSMERLNLRDEKKKAQYEILGVKNSMELKNKILDYIVQEKTPVTYIDKNGNTKTFNMSKTQALTM